LFAFTLEPAPSRIHRANGERTPTRRHALRHWHIRAIGPNPSIKDRALNGIVLCVVAERAAVADAHLRTGVPPLHAPVVRQPACRKTRCADSLHRVRRSVRCVSHDTRDAFGAAGRMLAQTL
jgi:hypothetical protein